MTISPNPESTWRPTLVDGEAPLHARLAEALARDIRTGRLAVGARLPTHRDLAYSLGVGVGTVTRAYAEAEAKGLIAAQVGRGSFVAGPAPRLAAEGPLDLARNLGPAEPAERRLREAFRTLAKRGDLTDHLAYAPPMGQEAHRRAGAAWIARTTRFETPDWTRLMVCPGGQAAMTLTLARLCKAGDTVLAEAGTFYVMRILADYAGYRVRGVAMDAEGLAPEALDRMARETGARVLYTMPTLQNPTGRTMGPARRAEIAEVARARDLWIVEDDIYGAFAPDAGPPLATLAPERTFYLGGLSKILAPGLRTGYLIAPDSGHVEALVRGVRATSYAPPTFGSLIATQWIEDETADQIAADVRAETQGRRALALDRLGDALEPGAGEAPHIWAPMPELAAERLAGRCLREGVELTPPGAPVVDPSLISGVRLCLGAPRDREGLAQALDVVAGALADRADLGVSSVI
jgi:DNA-binding transcriptional MocR family regulator